MFRHIDVEIREQTSKDSGAVHALVEAAFGGTEEADLVDALIASGDAELALVMEAEARIVGHILFSRLRAPEGSLALAPVSVAPDRQNGGIGSALIRDGIRRAQENRWGAVFVLGEAAYYGRFGFRTDAAAKFETAYPRDYFMALDLVPGFLADRAGPVVYPAPFQDLADP